MQGHVLFREYYAILRVYVMTIFIYIASWYLEKKELRMLGVYCNLNCVESMTNQKHNFTYIMSFIPLLHQLDHSCWDRNLTYDGYHILWLWYNRNSWTWFWFYAMFCMWEWNIYWKNVQRNFVILWWFFYSHLFLYIIFYISPHSLVVFFLAVNLVDDFNIL